MSFRAPRASSRASSAAWRAWASSDSFPTRLCSKPSLFFTASWSSRSAVMTLASCFSRSACSASAFLLASAKAFFSASYSAPAPSAHNTNIFHYAQLFVRANFKTNVFNIPCLSSNCFLAWQSSSLARSSLCFSPETSQCVRSLSATTPAYSHKTYLVSFLRKLLDPLSGFSFRTPDSVSGATVYTVTFFLHNCVAYLKAC